MTHLPLGCSSLSKITELLEFRLDDLEFQKIKIPSYFYGGTSARGRELNLPGDEKTDSEFFQNKNAVPQIEISVTDLVKKQIHSYRQLPQKIYFHHSGSRTKNQQKSGSFAPGEYSLVKGYGFFESTEDVEEQSTLLLQTMQDFFEALDIPVLIANGNLGPNQDQEFSSMFFLHPKGEELIAECESCHYASQVEAAKIRKIRPAEEEQQNVNKVATPDCKTIADLAAFLEIPKVKTAKVVFYTALFQTGKKNFEKLVIAVIRGDMEVSTEKLADAIGAAALRPAREEEISIVGAIPGYGSPIGIHEALIVADDLVPLSPNLVAGANEFGFHYLNVNYGRDFLAEIVADITQAQDGDSCVICGSPLKIKRGVLCADIYQLGSGLSERLGCGYLDNQGHANPIQLVSFRVMLDRLLVCISETHNDENGLALPWKIAPLQVHLIVLGGKDLNPAVIEIARRVYSDLQAAGYEVLLDDRSETPGVKFNDADLIGLPARLTVSERGLNSGGLELKYRTSPERVFLSENQLIPTLQEFFSDEGSQFLIRYQPKM